MIIIEGPDGSGKTNLLKKLSHDLGLPQHERASHSERGPVDDLWNWVCRDVMTWDVQPLSIYDRHPLISEFIYGPIIRGRLPEGFLHSSARAMLMKVQQQALVVFCAPPLEVVKHNVSGDVVQMAGVRGNVDALYWSYQGARSNWPGWAMDFDYTVEEGKGSYMSVLRSARLHIATWKA